MKKINCKNPKIYIIFIIIVSLTLFVLYVINHKEKNEICLIQFDSNGGSSVSEQKIECGNYLNEPKEPTKDSFTFNGWYLNNKKFNFNKKINDNIILVAHWNKNSEINTVFIYFDSNGGTKVEEIEIEEGKSTSQPIPPTREGYSFDGWYLNNEKFDFNKEIYNNITLVAKWDKIKTNTNKQNQGSNNNSSNNKKEESNVSSSSKENNKYYCSSGYELKGDKCEKHFVVEVKKEYEYVCPEGYLEHTSSGKCRREFGRHYFCDENSSYSKYYNGACRKFVNVRTVLNEERPVGYDCITGCIIPFNSSCTEYGLYCYSRDSVPANSTNICAGYDLYERAGTGVYACINEKDKVRIEKKTNCPNNEYKITYEDENKIICENTYTYSAFER